MFYIYILFLNNPEILHWLNRKFIRSFMRHNSGRSKSTKIGIPSKLLYNEEFPTLSQAMLRENKIKAWKSHSRI